MPTPMKHQTDDAVLASLGSALDAIHRPHPTMVRDIMTTDVGTCRATDTADRCAQIMWDRACGAVPVVGDDGRPIAMITDRDICMAAYLQGEPLSRISVASVMSKRLIAVAAGDPVTTAETLMRLYGVRRLPVVDEGGVLVGVLSIDDIAARADVGQVRGRDALSVHAVAGTVAAVSHSSAPPKP